MKLQGLKKKFTYISRNFFCDYPVHMMVSNFMKMYKDISKETWYPASSYVAALSLSQCGAFSIAQKKYQTKMCFVK